MVVFNGLVLLAGHILLRPPTDIFWTITMDLLILISGRVFGKQPYRMRSGQYGTEVSFNLDCGEHRYLIGEQTVTQKLSFFPGFKLGKNESTPPSWLDVGRPLLVGGDCFAKVPKDAYSLNDRGRRVDDLTRLDWKWVTIKVDKQVLRPASGIMLHNIVFGSLQIEKTGHHAALPGTFALLSRESISPKETEPVFKYRRAYVRAYAPPSINLPAQGTDVIFKGRLMRHPIIKDDAAPMIYIDQLIT